MHLYIGLLIGLLRWTSHRQSSAASLVRATLAEDSWSES